MYNAPHSHRRPALVMLALALLLSGVTTSCGASTKAQKDAEQKAMARARTTTKTAAQTPAPKAQDDAAPKPTTDKQATKTAPVKANKTKPSVLPEQQSRQKVVQAAITAIKKGKMEDFQKLIQAPTDEDYYCDEQDDNGYYNAYAEEQRERAQEYLKKAFSQCVSQPWGQARLIERKGLSTASQTDCDGRKKRYYVQENYRVGVDKNLQLNLSIIEYSNPTKAVIYANVSCYLSDLSR